MFGTTDVLNKSVRYQDKENLIITAVIKDLPENFLVMNGDVLTDLNFDHKSLLRFVTPGLNGYNGTHV